MLVIPAIDLIDGKCVRLFQGDYQRQTTYQDDPVDRALRFQEAGFQRLHVVDLEGARLGRGANRSALARVVKAVSIPVQAGGGIRSQEAVEQFLEMGLSYLILGTVVLNEREEVDHWMQKWGAQRFIVSLDLRQGRLQGQGWTEESSVRLREVIERCGAWGIPQVICTDIERDGTLEEPNYKTHADLIEKLPKGTFLIAAGGVSRPEHVKRLKEIGVSGAIVGRALYEGELPWEALVHAG